MTLFPTHPYVDTPWWPRRGSWSIVVALMGKLRRVLYSLIVGATVFGVVWGAVAGAQAQAVGRVCGIDRCGRGAAGGDGVSPGTGDGDGGAYRVTGGGADMWGSADAFHLTWVRMEGTSAVVTADVRFPEEGVAALAKGVLIFRQGLDPGSAYADAAIHGDGHITTQYRRVQGGTTEDTTATVRGGGGGNGRGCGSNGGGIALLLRRGRWAG